VGGAETSVIRCSRELARRGHDVRVYTNCDGPVEDEGVSWRPLDGSKPQNCDCYIAAHQPELVGFVRKAKRRALCVLWPVSQLRHYKKIWRMWLYRPIPILISQYQADTYSPLLPQRGNRIIIPHGLPDDVRAARREQMYRHGTPSLLPIRSAIFSVWWKFWRHRFFRECQMRCSMFTV
jgi:Glycosyltransferase Family 4